MRSGALSYLACVFAGLAVLARAAPAVADGAFPASDAILLPADRPQQIVLSTNFGLIISDDGGDTWQWTCERPETSMASSYVVGAPPADRIYSRSPDVGLAVSDDASCTWRRAGGALTAAIASDVFPDPTDPTHVLAIAAVAGDGGLAVGAAVYESTDGGDSFAATPLFVAPDGDQLLGVEIARADPRVIYVALAAPGSHPAIARSDDAGAHWMSIDVEPSIGAGLPRIIAVDPADADVLYLRVIGAGSELLAVSRDGGMSFTTPITLTGGNLSAFARLASGAVLVAGVVPGDGGTTSGVTWRSDDGGTTFGPWTLTPTPRLRALGERAGTLYLAGDNYMDGWALAASSDEGRTLQPLVRYEQVSGVKACVMAACQDSCDEQAGRRIWGPEVCNPLPADAGADGGKPAKPPSGCGCSAAAPGRGIGVVVVALVVAAAMARGSAARGRRRGRSCSPARARRRCPDRR
jgi:hypothetical protein